MCCLHVLNNTYSLVWGTISNERLLGKSHCGFSTCVLWQKWKSLQFQRTQWHLLWMSDVEEAGNTAIQSIVPEQILGRQFHDFTLAGIKPRALWQKDSSWHVQGHIWKLLVMMVYSLFDWKLWRSNIDDKCQIWGPLEIVRFEESTICQKTIVTGLGVQHEFFDIGSMNQSRLTGVNMYANTRRELNYGEIPSWFVHFTK